MMKVKDSSSAHEADFSIMGIWVLSFLVMSI